MISKFKMIVAAAAAILAMSGCTDKTKFTITGQTDSPVSGNVRIMLFSADKNQPPTFITDTIVNNKFRVQGAVDSPVLAFLFLDNKGPMVDFMLETGQRYKITVNNDVATVETASKEEILNRELRVLQNSEELQQLYRDLWAAQAGEDQVKANELTTRIETLGRELEEKQIELIRNNPTLTAPAFRLFVKKEDPRADLGFEELKRLYAVLGDAARNTDAAKSIAQYISRVESVVVGMPAPDFTAKTPEGGDVKFSDIKAKVKILDFWASWCAPCREANSEMAKLYKDYKAKGLEIVSFSLDSNGDSWKKAIGEDGMNWVNLSDLMGMNSEVGALYVVKTIPIAYVIDESNTIIGVTHLSEDIKALVEARLAK